MRIELDHHVAPWAAQPAAGPFAAVYVSDGLTLDFDTLDGSVDLPVRHDAFRVDDSAFDAILARLKTLGIAYRSTPHGPRMRRSTRSTAGASSTGTSPTGMCGRR